VVLLRTPKYSNENGDAHKKWGQEDQQVVNVREKYIQKEKDQQSTRNQWMLSHQSAANLSRNIKHS